MLLVGKPSKETNEKQPYIEAFADQLFGNELHLLSQSALVIQQKRP